MIAYDTVDGVRMARTDGCRVGMTMFSDRRPRGRAEAIFDREVSAFRLTQDDVPGNPVDRAKDGP